MILRKLATVAALTTVMCHAVAANVEGTSSGVWINPQPLGRVTTGVGTDVFTWGTAVAGSSADKLSFASSTFDSSFETPFVLGTVSYFNGSIADATGITSVDLGLTLDLGNPAVGAIFNDFKLTVDSTHNTSDPDASADSVNLSNVVSSSTFVVDGTAYHVQVTGFANVIGDGFLVSDPLQFHVRENGSASAQLMGVVTSEVLPVPEPETYALMLGGLLLVGAVVRRQKSA